MDILSTAGITTLFGVISILNSTAVECVCDDNKLICVCCDDTDIDSMDITNNGYDSSVELSSITTVDGVCNGMTSNSDRISDSTCNTYNVYDKYKKRKNRHSTNIVDMIKQELKTEIDLLRNDLHCTRITSKILAKCMSCSSSYDCECTSNSDNYDSGYSCDICYNCCDSCRDSISTIPYEDICSYTHDDSCICDDCENLTNTTCNSCNTYNTHNSCKSCATIPYKPELKLDKCKRGSNSILLNNFERITVTFLKRMNIQVTLIGGGGAGGVGFSMSTYYICGSGGASGCCKVKMVEVEKCEKWLLTIGKGGDSLIETHGTDTVIESRIKNECSTNYNDKFKLVGKGGMNGKPYLSDVMETLNLYNDTNDYSTIDFASLLKGGCVKIEDVKTDCQPCIDNDMNCKPGEDGGLGLPSQTARTGCGGATHFTGLSGKGGDRYNRYGSNGSNGSGGGGSMPSVTKNIMDLTECTHRISGVGGNGYVMLTLLDLSCETISDVIKIQTC
jgi:hypothetical protein